MSVQQIVNHKQINICPIYRYQKIIIWGHKIVKHAVKVSPLPPPFVKLFCNVGLDVQRTSAQYIGTK